MADYIYNTIYSILKGIIYIVYTTVYSKQFTKLLYTERYTIYNTVVSIYTVYIDMPNLHKRI
mgnify:CR=1 FL=1